MKLATIKKVIADYEATGRNAHHYPRLGRISLNGMRSMPEVHAVGRMRDTIATFKAEIKNEDDPRNDDMARLTYYGS